MPSPLLSKCARILAERQLCIACAESATAGRLSAEFSLTAESGKILKGGLVCYDAALKTTLLGIPNALLKRFTPESAEVTAALAERLPVLIPADIHIAITGLTTPGGSETPEKPVGTMFIDIWYKQQHSALREVHHGSPEQIMLSAIESVAGLLIKLLG